MANKYFKNFILCGEIDYYCLLCKEHFYYLFDVDKHIRWENHRKSVKDQVRSNKFKKQVIFKIEDLFYCEVCNYIAKDMDTMSTHVGGDLHKSSKAKPKTEAELPSKVCSRESDFIIVSDIIIEKRDWHVIVGKVCKLCNKEIHTMRDHVYTTEHLFKLLDSKVTVDGYERCYRKINDIFYCFICKRVFPMSEIQSHWTADEHSEKRKACIYRTTATTSLSEKEDKKNELKKKLILSLKDSFTINFENGEAFCLQCDSKFPTDFPIMLKHQKSHGDVSYKPAPSTPVIVVENPSSPEEEPDDDDDVIYCEVQDHGKRRSELAKFGKERFIKLHPGGGRGYCSLCHTNLSASMKLFKQHLRGYRHKSHLEMKGLRWPKTHPVPEAKRKILTDFFTSFFYKRTVGIIWVNHQYCIDVQSFILVSNVEKNPHFKKTKCFVCDVFYNRGEDLEHYTCTEHKSKFLSTRIVAWKDEFIREIRPDLYHCGFCNKLYPYWDSMEKHMAHWKHKDRKKCKELVMRLADQWYDDKLLIKASKNPDIMYIQIIRSGILF